MTRTHDGFVLIVFSAPALGVAICSADDPPTKPEKSRKVERADQQKRAELIKKYKDGTLTDAEKVELRKLLRGVGGAGGAGRTTPADKPEVIGSRVVTELQYESTDGRKIPAVLTMPRGDGPFPIIVTIHGGQGNRDYNYLRTLAVPNRNTPTVNALNEQPWAVLAISYRAGEVLGGKEEDDVVAGIRYARKLPGIDPRRVGVLGGSHGGHLALRAAELMGKEFRCLAVGSPWMTDPKTYLFGKGDQPPLSLVPQKARDEIMSNGKRLRGGLERRVGNDPRAMEKLIAEHSIEANAARIEVPTLFLTSASDEQVPHVMVQPTIDKLKAAGGDVTVFTAEKCPHGFYWGREAGGARLTRGEKTADERAEEERAREAIIAFFQKQLARRPASQPDAPNDPPKPEAKAEDQRRKLDPKQADAIRKLRSRMSGMKTPDGLEKRTIKVGEKDREYFIHVPPTVKGKPAPVMFALHGGASSSGLSQYMKVDYTTLADKEGFVLVYPSGVNGWNIGSHDAYSVQRRTSNADDLGFFRAMFDTLEKEGVADPKRIYVTGGSNGGVMTQFLACAMPERIAGIGVMVATLPKAADKDWPKPGVPVPTVIMLGTRDTFKPWDGSKDQYSAAETVAFWRRLNGCTDASTKREFPDRDPKDECRVRSEAWTGRAPVVLYTLDGHGHGWPKQRGNIDTGTGPKTRDISAPEEFWAFLKDKTR
jgi:polyhydroxybutyrate depolymerase